MYNSTSNYFQKPCVSVVLSIFSNGRVFPLAFIKYWLPVCLYILLIIFVSSLPHPPVPRTDWINIDKLYHFIEYSILGILVLRAFINSGRGILANYAVLWAIFVTMVFAATDEIHQAFVPNRSASIADWIFDILGATIGAFAMYLWNGLQAKKIQKYR